MAAPIRLYNFAPAATITAAEFNAEFNQIIAALVNKNTDGTDIQITFDSDTRMFKSSTKEITIDDKAGGLLENIKLLAKNIVVGTNAHKFRIAPHPTNGYSNTITHNCSWNGSAYEADDNTKPAMLFDFFSDAATGYIEIIWKNTTSSPWTTWDYTNRLIDTSGTMKSSGDLEVAGALIGEPVAFSVNRSSSVQAIPASTWTKVSWDTEVYDTNSDFSGGTFTPTVAGKYQFNVNVRLVSVASGTLKSLEIRKNGSAVSTIVNHENGGSESMYLSASADANGSSDYFDVYILHQDSVSRDVQADAKYSRFDGFLIALSST